MNGVREYVAFCDRLLSLSILFSKSIRVVAYVSTLLLLMAE